MSLSKLIVQYITSKDKTKRKVPITLSNFINMNILEFKNKGFQ